VSVENKPRLSIREFTSAVDAASAIEEYLADVVANYSYHEVPVKAPEKHAPFDRTKMHVSDIAGACPRKPILVSLAPEDKLIEQTGNGFFISGHMHEAWVVGCLDLAHESELVKQKELAVLPPEMQSHIDVWWPNRKLVIEIKSISVTAVGTPNYPRDSALRQAATYANYLREETGEDHMAVVIYVFREDPARFDVFPVPDHLQLEMSWRVDSAVKNYRDGAVPVVPEDFQRDRFPCFYRMRDGREFPCPAWNLCWEGKDAPQSTKLDDPSANKALASLASIHDKLKELAAETKALKDKRRELETMLKPHFDEHYAISIGNNRAIKRIDVPSTVRYDYAMGVKKGYIGADVLTKIEGSKKGYSYTLVVKEDPVDGEL
jgi:hypothetical protein